MRERALAAALTAALVAVAGCRSGADDGSDGSAPTGSDGGPTPPSATIGVAPGALSGFNVLLVTVDTLRADVVGTYGGPAGLTPRLDRLAAEGVRFEWAFAHASMTLPSHASILTGEYPFRHGVRANGTFRLADERVSLAEILADAGYRTGAFVGAFVLDTRFGLAQGFELYDDYYGEGADDDDFNFRERPADQVLAPAAAWITAQPAGPWLAWVHLFDPHLPYEPPDEYLRGRRAAPYEAEVAYVDAALGSFFDGLSAAGALENTLIVFTADHGESLGEHGEQTHGAFGYNATLRVPLILWAGSHAAPAVVSTPAAHVDIAPTVLAMLGLAVPETVQGVSLLAAEAGASAESASGDRPIYFEALDGYFTQALAPLAGVVRDDHKYVDVPVRELYDLSADPDELVNLARAQPAVADRYRGMLEELLGAAGTPASRSPLLARMEAGSVRGLEAGERERLAALGYLPATLPAAREFTPADDPKNAIALIEKQRSAAASYSSGAVGDAVRLLREVIEERPAASAAKTQLASILFGSGNLDEAISLLETARRDNPDDAAIAGKLGFYLAVSGETQRAAALLEGALDAAPDRIDFLEGLAIVRSSSGRGGEARALLERALEIDPSSASLHHNMGLAWARDDDLEAAVRHFERAIELAPDFWFPYEGLASAMVAAERYPEAVEAWRTLVELNPSHLDAIYNLGVVLAQLGREREALVYLERYVADAPTGAPDVERVAAMAADIRRRLQRP